MGDERLKNFSTFYFRAYFIATRERGVLKHSVASVCLCVTVCLSCLCSNF